MFQVGQSIFLNENRDVTTGTMTSQTLREVRTLQFISNRISNSVIRDYYSNIRTTLHYCHLISTELSCNTSVQLHVQCPDLLELRCPYSKYGHSRSVYSCVHSPRLDRKFSSRLSSLFPACYHFFFPIPWCLIFLFPWWGIHCLAWLMVSRWKKVVPCFPPLFCFFWIVISQQVHSFLPNINLYIALKGKSH